MDNTGCEEWIRDVLVPGMVRRNDFAIDENPEAYEIDKLTVGVLPPDGTFMLTKPYKIMLTLVNRGRNASKTFNLIAKVTPNVPEQFYVAGQLDILFENETTAYNEIIPLLPDADKYPRFYYSKREPLKAVVVMGDFSISGWRMAPQVYNLPLDHILLAVKELGRFHGSCYAIKHGQRDKFDSVVAKFKESRYSREYIDPIYDLVMKVGPKRAVETTRDSVEFGDLVPRTFLEALEHLLQEPLKYGKKSVVPEEPLAVICHGDFLRNNLAFQYAEDGTPTGVMMFDFQTLRYASPMIDLSTFIANSTGYDVRSKHFDKIFQTYHDELVSAYCESLDGDATSVPDFMSYDSLLKEFARKYTFGFCIASSFLNMLHVPLDIPIEEMVSRSADVIMEDAYTRGGESVNKELRGMVYEIFKLQEKFGLKLE